MLVMVVLAVAVAGATDDAKERCGTRRHRRRRVPPHGRLADTS